MADEDELLAKVHGLSDLELAALLSLISREHCLISTLEDALDELVDELKLISSRTFGLSSIVVDCCPDTTLEQFAAAILLASPAQPTQRTPSPYTTSRTTDYFLSKPDAISPHQRSPSPVSTAVPGVGNLPPPGKNGTSTIANVVIAKNLNRAPRAVQIQALELLRTRRLFTRTAVHAAPHTFLFIAALESESSGARVTEHLNDFIYISHWHDPEDGFANLEETWSSTTTTTGSAVGREGVDIETSSTESVVRRRTLTLHDGSTPPDPEQSLFSAADITRLADASRQVQVDIDVVRYQMNIISFLRMHRAIAGGVSPVATKHFETLMRGLAPLHGLDYVTPALVALAARKIYLHRIEIVSPEKERSMQWGSELGAVAALLEGVGPEDVVEDVLETVAVPL